MPKTFLTTKQIAEYCQVTQRTAVQWINAGKVKSFRTLGKHIRVNRADFVAFLKKNEIPIPEDLRVSFDGNLRNRILIVDTDEGMVATFKRILGKEKFFDLEVAHDEFEAGRKFFEFKPQLVILGPGIDGYEICAKIRREAVNKDVKILVTSGVMNKKEIERAMSLGANDYLVKPFNHTQLKSKVARLFNWNRRLEDRKKKEN